MAKQRTDVQQQLAELLVTAKKSLRLSVSFISRMDGTTQHLEVVEASVPLLFREGAAQQQSTSCCQAIRDGELPAVIPDVTKYPAEIEGRLGGVVADGGPTVLLQPIVELATGRRTGVEALSRFPRGWGLPPDVCFEEAHSVGQGDQLELMALERRAAARPGAARVRRGRPLPGDPPHRRVRPPAGPVAARGGPPRALRARAGRGLRGPHLGARAVPSPRPARRDRRRRRGFSSLRHIVLTAPDVIKLDRSIVAGVALDRVLTTLIRSLVDFAHDCGASVVAEGIETAEDVTVLQSLGVDHGQGSFFGKADEPEALPDRYAVPVAA